MVQGMEKEMEQGMVQKMAQVMVKEQGLVKDLVLFLLNKQIVGSKKRRKKLPAEELQANDLRPATAT